MRFSLAFELKLFYLGDIRVLKAIDVPHLHHLHDCIVFPCNGKNEFFLSFENYFVLLKRSASTYQ